VDEMLHIHPSLENTFRTEDCTTVANNIGYESVYVLCSLTLSLGRFIMPQTICLGS